MRTIIPGLLALTAGLFFLFAPFTAQAAGPIKMLPPTGCGTTGGVNGILTWDGVNPLGCITGLQADNSGDVAITGTSPTTSPLTVTTQSAPIGIDASVGGANSMAILGTGTGANSYGLVGKSPYAGVMAYNTATGAQTWLAYNSYGIYSTAAQNVFTGTVQIGSGSCTIDGQLQWNPATKAVQYCYQSVWHNLGGGAACPSGGNEPISPNFWNGSYYQYSADIPAGTYSDGYLYEYLYQYTDNNGNLTSSDELFQCQNGIWKVIGGV